MSFEQGRSLPELFLANGGRTIHKWVHYFEIYERHFRRYVDKAPTVLEIGIGGGGSISMWQQYFGEGCQIVGLDISAGKKRFEREGIEIFIGSQDDPEVLDAILEKYDIDIVIDDGSHVMSHLVSTFHHLYDQVDERGIYLAEDLHTCYWPEFEGGLGEPGSFMELVKDKVDELNGAHIRGDRSAKTEFTRSTAGICVYDSIVVFERSPQGERTAPRIGAMQVLPEGLAAGNNDSSDNEDSADED